jgi:hypothetical protein
MSENCFGLYLWVGWGCLDGLHRWCTNLDSSCDTLGKFGFSDICN